MTLDHLVARFADAHPELQDPHGAHDQCVSISEEFADLLVAHGHGARVVDGIRFGEMPEFPGERLVLGGHYAVAVHVGVDEVVYDWTARQFDPDATVPTVVMLSVWRSTWTELGGLGERR